MKKKNALALVLILMIMSIGFGLFWLDKYEVKMKVITIQGSTHYDLGVSYGRQCRHQIQGLQTIFGAAEAILRFGGYSDAQAYINAIDPWIPQYLKDEMNGTAVGAGVPYSSIFLLNAFADILNEIPSSMACSQFIFTNKTNTAAGPIYGRNLDYAPSNILDNFQVVLRIFPPAGNPVIGHTITGMVGLLGGMNSKGVSIAVSQISSPEVGPGTPTVLAIRDALHHANNTVEGTGILNGTLAVDGAYQNQTAGWVYGVLDPTGSAAFVEATKLNAYTRWEGDTTNGEYVGWICATNHFVSTPMKDRSRSGPIGDNSVHRLEAANYLMAQANATQRFGPYEAMATCRSNYDPVLGFNWPGERCIDNYDVGFTGFIPGGSLAAFIMVPLLNYTLVTLTQPSQGYFYCVNFNATNSVIGPVF